MRSPYSLSRTTQVLTPEEPKGQLARANITREVKERHPAQVLDLSDPKHQMAQENRTRKVKVGKPEVADWDPFVEESNSVTAESDSGNFEYEHWGDGEMSGRSDCRAACSDGTETVAAFGDAVSEVFDLINEVAFPGVIDSAADERLIRDGESYDEDDDSIFIGSKSYDKREKAREFLDFIGAARPRNQKIVTTPLPPPDLLSPSGVPLGLPSVKETLVPLGLPSIRETFLPVGLSSTKEISAPVKGATEQESRDDYVSINDGSVKVEQADQDMKIKEDEAPRERKIDRDQLDQRRRRKPSDRYTSLLTEDSDEWSDGESECSSEDDYRSYINDVLRKREKRETTPNTHTRLGSVQSPISGARNKYTTSHRLKQIKEQAELLTIAESSYEDEDEEDFGDPQEVLREIIRYDAEETNDDNDEEEFMDSQEILREIISYDGNERSGGDFENTEKTEGRDGSDFYSSTASESSFSSYEEQYDANFVDDSTVSFEDSDDSLCEGSVYDEGESFTNHTRSTIGKKDSFGDCGEVEECIGDTNHTRSIEEDESSFDEEDEDDDDDYGDDESEKKRIRLSAKQTGNGTRRTHSVAESLLKEDDEEESTEDNKHLKYSTPRSFTFCSAYDLYSADSIFSFITHDENIDNDSLFDFDESATETDEGEPSMIIMPDLSATTTDNEDEYIQGEEEQSFKEEEEREHEQEVEEELQEEEKDEEEELGNEKQEEPEKEDGNKQEEEGYQDVEERERQELEEEDDRDVGGGEKEEQEREEEEERKNQRDNCISDKSPDDAPIYDPSETREDADDKIEENEEEKAEVEGVEEKEKVSRVSKTFSSVLYGNKRQIPASNNGTKHRRHLPPRRSPVIRYDSMNQTKSLGKSVGENREEAAIRDKHSRSRSSSSNSSRCSISSNESSQVDVVVEKLQSSDTQNDTIAVRKTGDHQNMRKRRAFARMKKYNQQRKSTIRLQLKAE
eukprot:jgi/Psemu1/69039/estExt_Genemark1.C_6830007